MAARRFGFHAVEQALSAGHVKQLWLQTGRDDDRIQALIERAKTHQVPIETTAWHRLTQLAGSDAHQGVVAHCKPLALFELSDLENHLTQSDTPVLLLVLDGIQDPHNLGACIRSANAAGVSAVIIPKTNSAKLTPAVHKVAAGGAEVTPVITVNSLVKTCELFAAFNVQCVGLAGEAPTPLEAVDYQQPTAFVVGNEGKGLHPALSRCCDTRVNIPMCGEVESLNVSVATGIALFEARRQRRNA